MFPGISAVSVSAGICTAITVQAHSQGFVQEGADLAWAHGIPLPKTENSSDLAQLFFWGPGQVIFYFLIFTIQV